MQKIEDGGPSKQPSASVRRLDFLKMKICTNLTQDLVGLPALSRLGKCQRVRELALRPAADSRSVEGIQKDGLCDVQKGVYHG